MNNASKESEPFSPNELVQPKVPVSALTAELNQPRKHFDESALEEMTAIKAKVAMAK